jgi:nitrite reductase (NO-forming)
MKVRSVRPCAQKGTFMREGSGVVAAQGSRPRRGWQLRANGVVLAYVLAAVVVLVADGLADDQRWLAVHLLLLGAVTNAVVVWGEYFAVALLRAAQPARGPAVARLVGLNLGVVGVLGGVVAGLSAVTLAAAALLTVVVLGHLYSLLRISAGALQGRFAGTVRFYVAAGVALLVGIGFGATIAVEPSDWPHEEPFHAAHVHANVFGWIGLTVLGTLFTLWPTVLRTRMVDGVMRAASWCLALTSVGLATAVTGFAVDASGLAAAGLAIYAAGVVAALRPFVATWRQKPPYDAASWSMGLAVGWLLVGVLVDLAMVVTSSGAEQYAGRLDLLVPPVIVGFVGQVLLGALTYLLPVVLGGGPAAQRASNAVLGRAWPVRVAGFNLAVPMLAVAEPGWVRPAGWALVVAATGSFLGLAAVAVVRNQSGRSARRPAAPPAGRRTSR